MNKQENQKAQSKFANEIIVSIRYSTDVLFFTFLSSCFKLKIYIIDIRLCRRVRDRKIFTGSISRNQISFFALSNINETGDMAFFPISFIIFIIKYNFQYNSKYFRGTFETHSDLTFTYSKPTIEILEKKMCNMFKVNNKNTRTTSVTLF